MALHAELHNAYIRHQCHLDPLHLRQQNKLFVTYARGKALMIYMPSSLFD